MNKTKIDWCDSTWNPVTGCLHGCEYCYARGIANRFAGHWYPLLQCQLNAYKKCNFIGKHLFTDSDERYIYAPEDNKTHAAQKSPCFELDYPLQYVHKGKSAGTTNNKANYPFNFLPTFHRYRLDEPLKVKKPQNIFVCSMADLFGEWVPDEWIKEVLEATNRAPQHRYLYLTKNPDRYYQLGDGDSAIIPEDGVNGWFGSSATTETQAHKAWGNLNCTWMSLEPLHGDFSEEFFWHDAIVGDGVSDVVRRWHWIVVGAETGNRKNKVIPKREWIENIVENCRAAGTPVFMKESLREIMSESFVQEFPWEV